jgi:hypothetical protein
MQQNSGLGDYFPVMAQMLVGFGPVGVGALN